MIFRPKNPNIYQKWVFVKVLSLSDPIDLLTAVTRLGKADNFLKWCVNMRQNTPKLRINGSKSEELSRPRSEGMECLS